MQKKTRKKTQLPQHNENQRIKAIRKLMGLTQQQFAAQIGISQAALSDIENEKNGISYDVFKRIVEGFHIRSEWLMYRNGEPFSPTTQSNIDYNAHYNPGSSKAVPMHEVSVDDVMQGPAQGSSKQLASVAIPFFSGKEVLKSYITQYTDWSFLQEQPLLSLPGLDEAKEYRAFEVRDDNMFPSVRIGNIVVGELLNYKSALEADKLYIVVAAKSGVKLGRAQKELKPSDTDIVLLNDNPNVARLKFSRKNIIQLLQVERVVSADIPPQQSLDNVLAQFGDSLDSLKEELARLKQ